MEKEEPDQTGSENAPLLSSEKKRELCGSLTKAERERLAIEAYVQTHIESHQKMRFMEEKLREAEERTKLLTREIEECKKKESKKTRIKKILSQI